MTVFTGTNMVPLCSGELRTIMNSSTGEATAKCFNGIPLLEPWSVTALTDYQVAIDDLQSQITDLQQTVGELSEGGMSTGFDPSTLDPATLTAAFTSGLGVVLLFWAGAYGIKVLLQFMKG